MLEIERADKRVRKSYTRLEERVRRLWRRLWWMVYVSYCPKIFSQ
jgi:hypothetical protein